jgi:hypothetical protein
MSRHLAKGWVVFHHGLHGHNLYGDWHMDTQLLVICFLTFVIHLIGTLAYAARIAGVRTRRIAVSFSLFNILILMSRTSNSLRRRWRGIRLAPSESVGAFVETSQARLTCQRNFRVRLHREAACA